MPKAFDPSRSLANLYPELSAQWHPTKNGDLSPDQYLFGSGTKIWWKCQKGPDHEWETSIKNRSSGRGCPFCRGFQTSVTNSLVSLYPEIAAQWHPTKNGDLTPDQIVSGSGKRHFWKCKEAPDHEWETSPSARIGGIGCPFCVNKRVSITNNLAALYPEIAAQWHPTKNGDLTPDQIISGSGKRHFWKCKEGPDHEWETSPSQRTLAKRGCPFCANKRVSVTNNLAALHPEIVSQWHPTKNGDLTPDKVTPKSHKKAWWQCSEGPDHKWEISIKDRVTFRTCPYCANIKGSVTNNIAKLYPELISEWHHTKNGSLTPEQATVKSTVWWKCAEAPDHEWKALFSTRIGSRAMSCPYCAGKRVATSNSLAFRFPEIAAQWHPTKNGDLGPDQYVFGSHTKVWWKCPEGPEHEWKAQIVSRTRMNRRCPQCYSGWTIENLRRYIRMLTEGDPPPLYTFEPAQLYAIYMQTKLTELGGKGKDFMNALQTGRFPKEEIEKFVNGEPSLVDEFTEGNIESVDEIDEDFTQDEDIVDSQDSDIDDADLDIINKEDIDDDPHSLPEVSDSGSILGALEHDIMASIDDKEALEFLMSASLGQLWSKVYPQTADVAAEIEQIKNFQGNSYGQEVRNRFLEEYESAQSLEIPSGYNFRKNGQIADPLLMQKHLATKVRDQKRVGNWSGTGAGKTLSAILASRVIDSSLTVILCPNAVVDMWQKEILDIYPNSQVRTKTWEPDWDDNKKKYLVLNYDMFQNSVNTPVGLQNFLKNNIPDFIIADEIHFTKSTDPNGEVVSTRRKYVEIMVVETQDINPNLHALGMSATPVINTLAEGISLLQIVTGEKYIELDIAPTVINAQKLYQQFVRKGLRWMPPYSEFLLSEERPAVDISEYIDEIRGLSKSNRIGLEQVLTRSKIPEILKHIKPKTLIYTFYRQGIDKILSNALTAEGWSVGFYTGIDKSGLEPFLKGNLDVLIATSAIGTGVNGLQEVCNRLIVNILPWTAAEYEQLKGRIYRTGQTQKTVDVIIPATYSVLSDGHRWSWDDTKWARVRFKKSLADAAVDGIVPEGKLRTPAEAYRDAMKWLERLDDSGIMEIHRPLIKIPFLDYEDQSSAKRMATYGDFSKMNRHWNTTKSENTHARLKNNPEEWTHYHSLYRERRKDWPIVPFEEMIRWLTPRKNRVVGDFGCGEALLAEGLKGICDVRSFDHIAINDDVIACDMSDVPLDDEELDVAVFSLSLMGSNYVDYLKESHRTLKLDGTLHIWEATSRFKSTDDFRNSLERLGFRQIQIEERYIFTYVTATKDKSEINYDRIEFRGL